MMHTFYHFSFISTCLGVRSGSLSEYRSKERKSASPNKTHVPETYWIYQWHCRGIIFPTDIRQKMSHLEMQRGLCLHLKSLSMIWSVSSGPWLLFKNPVYLQLEQVTAVLRVICRLLWKQWGKSQDCCVLTAIKLFDGLFTGIILGIWTLKNVKSNRPKKFSMFYRHSYFSSDNLEKINIISRDINLIQNCSTLHLCISLQQRDCLMK